MLHFGELNVKLTLVFQGYAGRTNLPDVLSALLRPVQMSIPEYDCLAEMMLIKSGFIQAHSLARKLVAIFKLCVQQLSSQTHYDFGLRNIMVVLDAAGKFKNLYPIMPEESVVLWATCQIFVPRLMAEDLALFQQIIKGLFPGLEQPQYDHTHLLSAFAFACEHQNLTPSPYFSHKALELYEILSVKHSISLIGEPYGGKSCCYISLAEALGRMSGHGHTHERRVQISVLNPNCVTLAELFGHFDVDSSTWTDGILTANFRLLCSDTGNDRKWMVIDGHVDATWGEYIMTLIDGNKTLCLTNGELLKIQDGFSLIIETSDLAVASPAFVSRNGIVFYDSSLMETETFQKSWIHSLPDSISDRGREYVRALFELIIPPCLEFLRKETEEIFPSCDNALVWTVMKVFDLLIQKDSVEMLLKNSAYEATKVRLQGIFVFSVIWSICNTVNRIGREKFNCFIRGLLLGSVQQNTQDAQAKDRLHPKIPDHDSIFHFYFHAEEAEWRSWSTLMASSDTLSAPSVSQDIFVETMDSVTIFYWLKIHDERSWTQSSQHKMPLLLVGPAAGKTTIISQFLSHHLGKSTSSLSMNFTEQTSSKQVQVAVQAKLEERQGGFYGPVGAKRCILFVDDVNRASRHMYGSRPPIELLRQYFCQKGWYDHSSGRFLQISGLNLICTMGDSVGAQALPPRRFVRWFHLMGVVGFDDEAIFGIYNAIAHIRGSLKGAPPVFTELAAPFVQATILVCSECVTSFQPSPTNPHYVFRPSDVGRVIASTACHDCPVEKEGAIRLWVHEALREFHDKLTTDDDRIRFGEILQIATERCFGLDLDKLTEHLEVPDSENSRNLRLRRLLFGDLQLGARKCYEEFKDPNEVLKQAEVLLAAYHAKGTNSAPLILFSYLIEHTLHLCRLLRSSGRSALLLGSAALGQRSCAKLAAYMFDMLIIEIEPTSKASGRLDWRESIKVALRSAGGASIKDRKSVV